MLTTPRSVRRPGRTWALPERWKRTSFMTASLREDAARAEEATLRARVRVPVIGDVAHVIVDEEVADLACRHFADAGAHVREMLVGRSRAVKAPHDHRHRADVALGDPA